MLKETKEFTIGGRKFVVEPLVANPDFNIVCMAFNEKGNTSLDRMNALNQRLYDESSYVDGPVYMNNWITSKTALSEDDYGTAPKAFVKRLGIPEKEWNRVKSVYVLRLCILNPFVAHYDNLEVSWKNYLEIMKKKIELAIQKKE